MLVWLVIWLLVSAFEQLALLLTTIGDRVGLDVGFVGAKVGFFVRRTIPGGSVKTLLVGVKVGDFVTRTVTGGSVKIAGGSVKTFLVGVLVGDFVNRTVPGGSVKTFLVGERVLKTTPGGNVTLIFFVGALVTS